MFKYNYVETYFGKIKFKVYNRLLNPQKSIPAFIISHEDYNREEMDIDDFLENLL